MDELIDYFLSAIENETRREILRMLTIDPSYALEMSRKIGISQQAINKQLFFLEKAGLIALEGLIPSSEGPPRRVYRPTNFCTIVMDYSKNFINIKRYDIDEANGETADSEEAEISKLVEIDRKIDALMSERISLLRKRDAIIAALRARINSIYSNPMARDIALRYIETLDTASVAERTGVPEEIVKAIVSELKK